MEHTSYNIHTFSKNRVITPQHYHQRVTDLGFVTFKAQMINNTSK